MISGSKALLECAKLPFAQCILYILIAIYIVSYYILIRCVTKQAGVDVCVFVVGIVSADSQSIGEGAFCYRVHCTTQVHARTNRRQYLVNCHSHGARHSPWTYSRRKSCTLRSPHTELSLTLFCGIGYYIIHILLA